MTPNALTHKVIEPKNNVEIEPETSETFLTGVSLTERVGSATNFLQDIFRGIVDTLASFFGGASTTFTRTSSSGGGIFDSPTPAASNKNKPVYRISLATTPKPLSPNPENSSSENEVLTLKS